jgi:hypothetical protein
MATSMDLFGNEVITARGTGTADVSRSDVDQYERVCFVFWPLTYTPCTTMSGQSHGPGLITLAPPAPPSDTIASALFLPISAIDIGHRGRKIRTIGQ